MPVSPTPILPDVLKADLKVVFCGTAAGSRSAKEGAYYAHPRNRFWAMLYQIGLTPRLLKPAEYRSVLDYGIGLTDLAKETFGADADLEGADFDRDGLRQKILDHAPRILAFNGKTAAKIFFESATIKYGQQEEKVGDSLVYVLPSTSPAAVGSWDEGPWLLLGKMIREMGEG